MEAKYTAEEPFDAPEALLSAIDKRDFGRYYDERLDSVPVNFLSTVDITGGNSGSPTMNGRGKLVGLVFDGTYDSINADWGFTDSTRAIHVDVGYMLWVMEHLDGGRGGYSFRDPGPRSCFYGALKAPTPQADRRSAEGEHKVRPYIALSSFRRRPVPRGH